MRRLRFLRWLVWPALAVLLIWLLRRAPLGEIWAVLTSISPWTLAVLVAFNALAMLVFSSRWWLALRAQGHRLPYWTIFRYRMTAFAISYFTPGTQFGGEPLQVYAVTSRHAVPVASAIASVALDKLFELIANFTFLVLGILVILGEQLFISLSPGAGTLAAGGMMLLPVVYLILLWKGRQPLSWLLGLISGRLSLEGSGHRRIRAIQEVIEGAEAQIHSLFRRQPLQILGIVGVSALIWLFSLAEFRLALWVLGAPLDLWQVMAALTASRLAFLTPIPGGLGALEMGQALMLQAMGFDPAIGLAMSLWIRVRDTGLGLIGLGWGASMIRSSYGLPRSAIHPRPSPAGD